MKNITVPGGVVTSMEYTDAARNQTRLSDPSAGIVSYTYNSRGQLKTQTDAQSRVTTSNYLPDGRMNTVVSPEGTTTYSYNTSTKLLTGINSPNSVIRSYGYDSKGRLNSTGDNIAGSNFSTTFTYDSFGRLSTRTHPTGIVETLNYNSQGYMSSISAGGATRYTITGVNARDQLTAATYGSSLNASYGFDTYGYPASTQTGSVQDYRYSFDSYTGNLSSRQNYLRGKSESFGYDNLERLTGVTGPQNLTMTFGDNGNINTKSDVGTTTFEYGASASPYAITKVTSSSGVIPTATQTATYTSFQKVSTIAENGNTATFIYNADNQRAQMTQTGTNSFTRWYSGGSYMKETASGVTREYTFLGGDAYSAPVAAITQSGATTYYYLLRDYLGNITHVYNSSNGATQEYSFDAWGRRRNPSDWGYDLSGQPELFAGRGFTSHEFLKDFNIYNMNGRLYDPLVGRFLSPDVLVQAPDYTQNYNRYSYSLNNPLKYVDPSGYIMYVPDVLHPANIDWGDSFGNTGSAGPAFNFFGNYFFQPEAPFGGLYDMFSSLDKISHSENGGEWSRSGGLHIYKNQNEAFIAGCMYNDLENSWNYIAGNFEAARDRYLNSGPPPNLTASTDKVAGPANNYRNFIESIDSNQFHIGQATDLPSDAGNLISGVMEMLAPRTRVQGYLAMNYNGSSWNVSTALYATAMGEEKEGYWGSISFNITNETATFRLTKGGSFIKPEGSIDLGYGSFSLPNSGYMQYIQLTAGYTVKEFIGNALPLIYKHIFKF